MCWEGAGPQGPTPWKQSRGGRREPHRLLVRMRLQSRPRPSTPAGKASDALQTRQDQTLGAEHSSGPSSAGRENRVGAPLWDGGPSRPVLSEGHDASSAGRKEPAGGDAVKDLASASWSHFTAHCALPAGPLIAKCGTNRLNGCEGPALPLWRGDQKVA